MNSEKKKVYSGDSCHWYDKDGNPMHEVKSADGKKMVKTTLVQARKLNLYPSVTTCFKLLNKHGVNEWKLDTLLKVVQEKGITGQGLTAYEFKSILMKHAEKEMNQGADEGTEIHKVIEKYFMEGETSDNAKHQHIAVQVRGIIASLMEGKRHEVECEKNVVNIYEGYAGCIDLLAISDSQVLLADIKTTSEKNYAKYLKKPYIEWGQQLAAYFRTLTNEEYFFEKGFSIVSIVACRDTGNVDIYRWSSEEIEKCWKMFKNLLGYYQELNNYKPEMVKE